MQINGYINTSFSQRFKGSANRCNDIENDSAANSSDDEWNVIAYDPATEDARKAIRKHYEETVLPFAFLYSDIKPSVTEHMFIHYPKEVNISQPIKLKDYKNSYRGVCLVDKTKALRELKENGIKTVINLAWGGNDYKEQIEDAGMEYRKCELDYLSSCWDHPEELDNFADMIASMKKGDFYIGCTLGTQVTDQILHIADYFVNPERPIKIPRAVDHAYVETILEEMTPEQKERMGLTKEDERALEQRLEKESYTWR